MLHEIYARHVGRSLGPAAYDPILEGAECWCATGGRLWDSTPRVWPAPLRVCGALEAEFRVFSSLQQQLTEPIGGESHRVPHRVAARVEESRGRGVAQRIALASRLGGGGERVALTGRLIRENTCDETGGQA